MKKYQPDYYAAKKIITKLMRAYDQGVNPKPVGKRALVVIRNYLAEHLRDDLTRIRVEERARAVLVAKYSKDSYVKKLMPYWTTDDYDFSEVLRPYIEIERKLKILLDKVK